MLLNVQRKMRYKNEHTNCCVLGNSVKRFEQDDGVTANYDHANWDLLIALVNLHCLVNDQIHEGIKASQNAVYLPGTIQLDCNAKERN